ncbi:MAG: DUF222 domain-containing protein, partial [Acidimicrobiia bacterium]|nr:DUF222 domain-containing protein [Acidimicrobiia bacterium]
MCRTKPPAADDWLIVPRLSDPEGASAEERDEYLMLLETVRHELEVEWTQTLAVAEDSADHDLFGYPSMVAYLKHRLRMAGGRAGRYVKNARAAGDNPATLSAWKHRQVTSDEAELLFYTSRRLPDDYSESETILLEMVGESYDETRQLLDYWRSDVNDREASLEAQQERRRLDVTRRRNGMIGGSFELSELAGETF